MNADAIHRMALALLACALAAPGLAQSPSQRTVHVFVALADNVNQGIVPVPPKLGKGDDPEHNLYWGAAAGVKTFFARSTDWQLISQRQRPKPEVLERCIFKHRSQRLSGGRCVPGRPHSASDHRLPIRRGRRPR